MMVTQNLALVNQYFLNIQRQAWYLLQSTLGFVENLAKASCIWFHDKRLFWDMCAIKVSQLTIVIIISIIGPYLYFSVGSELGLYARIPVQYCHSQ